jgi:hypothetical protein
MDKLGYTEVLDQVAAAREVAKRRYVDRARIGIWGWVSVARFNVGSRHRADKNRVTGVS